MNQFRHRDRAQVSRGGEQISINMMIERFGAKRIQFQFVDQILERVRKFFFAIPDKLGQGSFRFRSGGRRKIIRKTKVNAIDLRHLFVRNSRQFRQRSFSIWHNFSQVLWVSSTFLVGAGNLISIGEPTAGFNSRSDPFFPPLCSC